MIKLLENAGLRAPRKISSASGLDSQKKDQGSSQKKILGSQGNRTVWMQKINSTLPVLSVLFFKIIKRLRAKLY